MRFGTAKVITTPPFKMKLSCSGKMDVDYEDIYDDVYARCLVFENGDRRFVLMSFDLLFHDRSLNNTIAEYANEKYDVYEKGSVCAYTDLKKAQKKLKELTENLKEEMLDRLDEDDIVIDEGTMSYSIYWDYRYEELHTDYWIDEIDVDE